MLEPQIANLQDSFFEGKCEDTRIVSFKFTRGEVGLHCVFLPTGVFTHKISFMTSPYKGVCSLRSIFILCFSLVCSLSKTPPISFPLKGEFKHSKIVALTGKCVRYGLPS